MTNQLSVLKSYCDKMESMYRHSVDPYAKGYASAMKDVLDLVKIGEKHAENTHA